MIYQKPCLTFPKLCSLRVYVGCHQKTHKSHFLKLCSGNEVGQSVKVVAYTEASGMQDPKRMLGMQEVRQTRQARFHKVALDMCWRTGLLELGKR